MAWASPDASLGRSIPAWARLASVAWATGSACCLSFVAIGYVTGQDNLARGIHTGLCIAAILPALVVGAHDLQLGIRKVTLGLVVGGIYHRLWGFASTFFPRPAPLGFRFGAALPRRLRFHLGVRLQPLHGRLNLDQAVFPAGQLGRQFI